MTVFTARVVLIDDNEKKTTLSLRMGDISDATFGAEATTAQTYLDALIADLKAITTANVWSINLSAADPSGDADGAVPSSGSDVSEELVLVVHTNDSELPTETDILRVPSPEASVWVNDSYDEGFDINDALAAAYVANFETAFVFSDGESVNLSEGTDGIAEGFWRSRKMQIR